MASVTLTNLYKTYPGGVRAVRDLCLDVAQGELVVLVGPSGSGKSTTLRMIAGLEDATAGEIRLEDRRVNDLPPDRRDAAMVFQDGALYPHLTVRGNLAYGLKARGISPDEAARQADEAAGMLGLGPLLDRRPHELSGGEAQRVAIGRAIARRPALFLFDEPLSNLDAALRQQLRTELAALHRRLGATMLYVTHDQAEAMTLADRLVVLRAGAVQQVAAPLEVYRRPANRFVAEFIGGPGMNLFEGCVANGVFRSTGEGVSWPVASGVVAGPVVLGVRPEDLLVGGEDQPPLALARAEVVERLGHESLIHWAIGDVSVSDGRCVSRLPGSTEVIAGDRAPLTIGPGGYCLFASDAQGHRLD